MTPGPKPGTAKRDGQHMDNARAAWGDDAPVWVLALARACDATSQTKVGARIGYSGAAVSQTINGKYPGTVAAVEKAVRFVLLAEKVDCPVLGLIPANDCLARQRQGFTTSNPQAVRLARACGTCTHRQGGGHG